MPGFRDLDRCGHQGPRPPRRFGQLDHLHDSPLRKVENHGRLRSASGMRVGFKAVVCETDPCHRPLYCTRTLAFCGLVVQPSALILTPTRIGAPAE